MFINLLNGSRARISLSQLVAREPRAGSEKSLSLRAGSLARANAELDEFCSSQKFKLELAKISPQLGSWLGSARLMKQSNPNIRIFLIFFEIPVIFLNNGFFYWNDSFIWKTVFFSNGFCVQKYTLESLH